MYIVKDFMAVPISIMMLTLHIVLHSSKVSDKRPLNPLDKIFGINDKCYVEDLVY